MALLMNNFRFYKTHFFVKKKPDDKRRYDWFYFFFLNVDFCVAFATIVNENVKHRK